MLPASCKSTILPCWSI